MTRKTNLLLYLKKTTEFSHVSKKLDLNICVTYVSTLATAHISRNVEEVKHESFSFTLPTLVFSPNYSYVQEKQK